MKFSLRDAAEAAALSLVSASLFTGFFQVNALIFSHLEFSQGVNWLFLPAGFRVLLVLTMGLPGCLGIFLGNLFLDQDHLRHGHTSITLMTAAISGFTPWLVMKAMIKLHLLNEHLQDLTHQQLLQFTLLYAVANAVLHQWLWSINPEHLHNVWVEIWPMFIGDALGALIVIYAFKGLLNLINLPSTGRSL